MPDKNGSISLVGSEVLGLLTSGMYSNPLAIYREYIQNSADALAVAGHAKDGRVEIDIDLSGSRVKILDNGPGLSPEAAVRALLPIARSQKRRGSDRGFRGIGRLSGLAYAESITFLTRARDDQPITRIIWDGSKLRGGISSATQVEHVIRECVSVETLSRLEYPAHFFEVEISGIARHAAGMALNRDVVRDYIGEICSVPMAAAFPFTSEIDALFEGDESPLTLSIVLDGDLAPITRRHGGAIRLSESRQDRFTNFEEVRISSVDGNENAAVGWIAHSSYLGAIPRDAGIRGVRARVGNIQIGDETIFEGLFPEERFNRWCVGEVHILDSRIVPNGRRDYFEPGPHIRNLENQIGAVLRRIAAQCRRASSTRNKERKFLSALCRAEETYDLAISGYLSSKDSRVLVKQALTSIGSIRQNHDLKSCAHTDLSRLEAVEMNLDNFIPQRSRRPFGRTGNPERATYYRIGQAIMEMSGSPRATKEMIEAILPHVDH